MAKETPPKQPVALAALAGFAIKDQVAIGFFDGLQILSVSGTLLSVSSDWIVLLIVGTRTVKVEKQVASIWTKAGRTVTVDETVTVSEIRAFHRDAVKTIVKQLKPSGATK